MASTSGLPPSGGRDGREEPNKKKDKKAIIPRAFMKGKPKKQWSYEEKKKIIKMIEDGARTRDIVKVMGVPESSVRNMRKKKDEISAILSLLTECEEKVKDYLFEESEDAQHHLSKLLKLFDSKLNQKIQARQQSLITKYIGQPQMATLQVNERDDDDDDIVNQLMADDTQPFDEDMFEGWEKEEIEANRMNMLVQEDGQTDSLD